MRGCTCVDSHQPILVFILLKTVCQSLHYFTWPSCTAETDTLASKQTPLSSALTLFSTTHTSLARSTTLHPQNGATKTCLWAVPHRQTIAFGGFRPRGTWLCTPPVNENPHQRRQWFCGRHAGTSPLLAQASIGLSPSRT